MVWRCDRASDSQRTPNEQTLYKQYKGGKEYHMRKALLFGAGRSGQKIYDEVKNLYEVVGYIDSDHNKTGGTVKNIPVWHCDEIDKINFDVVIITSQPAMESMCNFLIEHGVAENQIITSYISFPLESRRQFLQDLSILYNQKSLSGGGSGSWCFCR